jgi:tetratricopeptide (TPR) repeat protein
VYAAKFGADHVLTADAIRSHAVANFEAGHLTEAEEGINRALVIYGRVYEGDHPTMADALIASGRIRSARGEGAAALAAFDRARGMFERIYGPHNSAVGDVDFYAAEAESARGDTAAALRLLARTKLIYDASYGPNDPDQVELLLLRARVLAAGRRFDEARRECAAGLALKSRLDPRDPTLGDTRQACAGIGASTNAHHPARVPAG